MNRLVERCVAGNLKHESLGFEICEDYLNGEYLVIDISP